MHPFVTFLVALVVLIFLLEGIRILCERAREDGYQRGLIDGGKRGFDHGRTAERTSGRFSVHNEGSNS